MLTAHRQSTSVKRNTIHRKNEILEMRIHGYIIFKLHNRSQAVEMNEKIKKN